MPEVCALLVCFVVVGSSLGCGSESSPEAAQDAVLRMHEVQVLGTHNSYHIQPRDSILEALATFDSQDARCNPISAPPSCDSSLIRP